MNGDIENESKASKLARVRENQRRCRSRKQEYVSDLEKRVADCHITCSQADLEKESRQRLELENKKLRDLLTIVGVESGLVDAYVNETVSETSIGASTTQQLRPLRPKLASESISSPPVSSATSQVSSILPQASPVPTPEDFSSYTTSPALIPSSYDENSGTNLQQTNDPIAWDAMQDSGSASALLPNNNQLCCGGSTTSHPSVPMTATDTTLCSIALSLIEQYNTTNSAVQEISDRLSSGFTSETEPGEGCRLQNQLLFHVLNDISAGLS